MINVKWMPIAMLAIVVAQARAESAPADLPPDAIGADTVFVIHADARHLKPELIRKAASSVLGDNVERANDFVTKFTDRYDRATKAGLESITIIGTSGQRVGDAEDELGANPNGPRRQRNLNPPVVYYHMRADGDPKIIEDAMTQDLPEKQKADVRFEQNGDWIVMHEKDQTPPEKVDADRTKMFVDALATMPEAAIAFAMIPDARSKADMAKTTKRDESPKLLKTALPIISEGKWITLAINLGNDPGVIATANTADAKSARQLCNAVDTALNDFKEKIANADGGPLVFLGPMLHPILDALRPIANGTNVTVNLKGEALTSAANLIITARDFAPQPPAPPSTPAKPTGKN